MPGNARLCTRAFNTNRHRINSTIMQTIIATTDFSRAATNAVNYAAEMALLIHADLVLFHSLQVSIGYMEVPFAVDLDGV